MIPLRILLGFILMSLLLVTLYRFVPPPVTMTMLLDANGITKDWTSLDAIDPDMARAAIAAEDGKFCSHHGFDVDAIAKAEAVADRAGELRAGLLDILVVAALASCLML